MWVDNQWGVTKLAANAADIGTAASAFGADSTMNGQIKNEKADVATAKTSASSIADPNAASDSDAAVEFERKFQLAGPPANWIVTLFGNLSGNLNANSADKNIGASAHVLGTAFIEDNQGNILFRIGGGATNWDKTVNANGTLPILSLMSNTMKLPNGQYKVFGLLEVSTHVDQGPLAIASANANFFNTMFIGLNAQPAPEPSTLVISSTAIVLLGLARWKRA